jgi:hypothetical protein
MVRDPHEWDNLAGNPAYASIMSEHRKWIPKVEAEPAKNSSIRVLSYDKTTDEAIWEGTTIHRGDPIPE